MKRILYVAYHFPPQSGSSGLLRSLKFCRYLPDAGWLPIVLSVRAMAYERVDPSQLSEIPAGVKVLRSVALDARRHLAIRQRYPRWLALPDRWASWCLSAVPAGLWTIYRERVDVILTTFPIASAVLIGLVLHRLTGRPWVLDLRDSMTEDDYPRDEVTRRIYRWIERRAIRHGSLFLFTAASTVKMYLDRYPELRPEKCILLPNGYDDQDFHELPDPARRSIGQQRPIRLLHTGLIYPEERDPRPFFKALARLKSEGQLDASRVQVDLRASGEEAYFAGLIHEMELEDLVHLLPPLPYRQALHDAAGSDAFLLLQGITCNHQIPAKVYEYLRLRKPILALTRHEGDTAALLRSVSGATIVDMYDAEAISQALPAFLKAVCEGTHSLPDESRTRKFERRNQALQLAAHLERLVSHS